MGLDGPGALGCQRVLAGRAGRAPAALVMLNLPRDPAKPGARAFMHLGDVRASSRLLPGLYAGGFA